MVSARVLILDPSALFRSGVRDCLERGGYTIEGEAERVEQALHFLAGNPVDLILIGATYSEADSFAISRILASRFPNLKIILITESSADSLFQVDAVTSGVDGLMRRKATHEECWAMIHQVIAGDILFSREILAASSPPIRLSERERAIVKLWADEKTDKEIAEQLIITRHTARTHAKNILRKLQVHNRVAAVRRARRRGLL